MDYLKEFRRFLEIVIKEQASDLILSVGHSPMIRITGQLVPLTREKIINSDDAKGYAFSIMKENIQKKFLEEKEIDFSYDYDGKSRFRVNVFSQRDNISMALRFIPYTIRTIEELGIPPVLHEFTSINQVLVLMTGASGQGKTSTLVAYIYEPDRAVIEQREIGQDSHSFTNALRATFRQKPDVIMVGEMRDLETISTTITAAETGHLVFATLHTNSSAQTVHRIVDVFPGDQQGQIRFQLSGSLLGIISQRLIPRIKGGFVPVCEVLICNNAVSTLIRENKIHEIPAVIETSAKEGMISSSRAMVDLVRKKEVSLKNATDYAMDPSEVRNLLK